MLSTRNEVTQTIREFISELISNGFYLLFSAQSEVFLEASPRFEESATNDTFSPLFSFHTIGSLLLLSSASIETLSFGAVFSPFVHPSLRMNHHLQQQQQHSGFPVPHRTGTLVSHVSEQQTSTWKRPRDPSTSDQDGSWNASFKRLKVDDDRDTSFPQPKRLMEAPQNAPPQSSHDYPSYKSNHPRQQAAGQGSSEAPSAVRTATCADYHGMNSLLGNLHLMRRQRTGETLTPQQPQLSNNPPQMQQQLPNPPSPRRHATRKNVVQLHVESNLY
jgi:hypothetical protein